MLYDLLAELGIGHSAFDNQIETFIAAAKADLKQAGIVESKIVETDPLIYSAITSFVLSMVDTYEYREMSANAYMIQKDQLRHYKNYTQE